MVSFDFDTAETRNEFLKKLDEDMLALPCGQKSVRFRPHLDFSEEDAEEALRFIKKALI